MRNGKTAISRRGTSAYAAVMAMLAATAAIIFALRGCLGAEPLVLFAVPVALAVHMGRPGPVLYAVFGASVMGDYFFVPPVGSLTAAVSSTLAVQMSVGALIAWLARRRLSRYVNPTVGRAARLVISRRSNTRRD